MAELEAAAGPCLKVSLEGVGSFGGLKSQISDQKPGAMGCGMAGVTSVMFL